MSIVHHTERYGVHFAISDDEEDYYSNDSNFQNNLSNYRDGRKIATASQPLSCHEEKLEKKLEYSRKKSSSLFPISSLKMLLRWNSDQGYPKTVLLIKSSYDNDEKQVKESFVPLAQYILDKGKTLFLEPSVIELTKDFLGNGALQPDRIQAFKGGKEEQEKIDLVITLGGDGTMLRSVSLFQHSHHIPVFLSFRFGTLGFLTPHVWCPDSFQTFIDKAFSGQIPVQLRCRLKGQIWKCDSGPHATPKLTSSRKVLNEVTIHRGLGSRVDLDVYVNDNFVTTISGDGVLVSTPSGSTAHALSAGASLVHPDIPCIMITPICVHSLSFRPIILPFNSVIKVLPADNSRFYPWVCFDGDELIQLTGENGTQEVIVIESAGPSDLVPCICSEEPVGDWLADLQERLYWNVSKTANSINPLIQNKLDTCSTSSEEQSNSAHHHPHAKKAMTKSASSITLTDPLAPLNGKSDPNVKFFRPRQGSLCVVDNKSYSILNPESNLNHL